MICFLSLKNTGINQNLRTAEIKKGLRQKLGWSKNDNNYELGSCSIIWQKRDVYYKISKGLLASYDRNEMEIYSKISKGILASYDRNEMEIYSKISKVILASYDRNAMKTLKFLIILRLRNIYELWVRISCVPILK